MTIKKHQSDNTEDNQTLENFEDKAKSVDSSRRGFTKAGLAASGVILTLASRPVLANTVCKSPSGFLSGNTSSHIEQMCFGNYPDYYANHPEAWQGTIYEPGEYDVNKDTNANNNSTNESESSNSGGSTNNTVTGSRHNIDKWVGGTPFQQAFPGSSQFPGRSMMQVLWMNNEMGGHCVAALLNSALGLTPPLTERRVVDIFLEYEMKGFFEPTAGVQWYSQDIIHYLNSLT